MNQTSRILEEVKKAVCGKDRVLVWVLTVLLARGHVLLEDIPGVGKTTMALAFSRALGLDYGRVQFTPDVLPSDITGYSVYQKESGKLVYQPGAVLCNLFLADELNRATSRTQSALLEAMEEGQVTVDGVSHPIPQPFIVFATQNPTGAAGTQLLPDSQMDRFTVRLSIGYPEPADECSMVLARQGVNPLQTVEQVLSRQELVAMQDEAAAVYIKKELVEYIVALIGATRGHPLILRGASPRATLSLTAMAKAVAYVQRRDYVVPKDIQVTFPQVIAHRLLLAPEADARQIGPEQILAEILRQVPAPRLWAMARNRIFYGLFLLAAVVFHSFYTGWFSFFLLLFSVLLPVFSLLVSLPAMLRAAYTPQLPLRCFCGQDAQFALQPSSASRLPVSCCRLHLLVCDAVGGTQQAEWLTLAGTLRFSLRVDTRHAGQQTFRVDRARVYDALGLVGLPLQLPTACSIAVEPEPLEPAELPNLSQFQYRSYHPKPGGGFSEIHDLREYRPGDSLHEIHWKLSAKTDKLIVREAEEPNRGLIVLSFDFSGSRTQLDSTLRQLLWLSGWLTDREVVHQIDWLDPDTLEPQTKQIRAPQDLQELLRALLQTHLTGDTPTIAQRLYPNADWRYHIQPAAQEVSV